MPLGQPHEAEPEDEAEVENSGLPRGSSLEAKFSTSASASGSYSRT